MHWNQIFFVSICFGLLGAYLATRRGANPYLWFFVGMFFGALGILAVCIPPKKKKAPRKRVRQPQRQAYIEGPSGSFWYYLDQDHQQKGPMSLAAITNSLNKGEILPTTLVWHEELSEWKALKELIRTSTTTSSP